MIRIRDFYKLIDLQAFNKLEGIFYTRLICLQVVGEWKRPGAKFHLQIQQD